MNAEIYFSTIKINNNKMLYKFKYFFYTHLSLSARSKLSSHKYNNTVLLIHKIVKEKEKYNILF